MVVVVVVVVVVVEVVIILVTMLHHTQGSSWGMDGYILLARGTTV